MIIKIIKNLLGSYYFLFRYLLYRNNKINITDMKCSICGESITKPVIVEGKMFGFSCAKRLYPNLKKSNGLFKKADYFTTELFENGNTGINAILNGVKYFDLIINMGNGVFKSSSIQIIDNTAYININNYKKQRKY